MYFGEIESDWMNERVGPEGETTELAVNDRCLNLLPFRRLAANDSDQPNAVAGCIRSCYCYAADIPL